ncbi:3-hydroxyisobutyrate dehydrogenase-like beta-hydroxyacid dehydrogenase [Agrobacterium vitis]|nr:3-hydroxyisobutyrate dehydrogenase-like beta-hydroxyacid dehydrogenase [Agrobacterium vitis]MBE1437866.1 3-hydroxyisobutyrate dehydrogenase-like beta-hydroxyacid dehydrogenase [Agrobacterium vitis]
MHNNDHDLGRPMKIAMIGFGEAAQAVAAGWRSASAELPQLPISAYDIQYQGDLCHGLKRICTRLNVHCAPCADEAVANSRVIFSLVTADQAIEAAISVSRSIMPGAFYFDCNSCAPSTKQTAAQIISVAGGHYIDVAIMAPIHPRGHRTPLLIASDRAEEACALLEALDMQASIAGSEIGQASAIKMLRSVMIKGLEALSAECILAARRAGVEDAVIASLQASDPGLQWQSRLSYNLERMMVHGTRRAAEMQEVAKTLRDLQIPDRMASAITAWQSQIGSLGIKPGPDSLSDRADLVLDHLADEPR